MSNPGFYVWIKACHVSAVLAFIGGLLATVVAFALLPLLGTSAAVGARQLLRWDRRLTAPALLLTWVFGLFLAVSGGWVPQLWLTIKLILVLLLSALHGIQSRKLRGISDGAVVTFRHSASLIVFSAAIIAALAVVKPNNDQVKDWFRREYPHAFKFAVPESRQTT
jgi:putative membrane protein